jgi:hypothetical protein
MTRRRDLPVRRPGAPTAAAGAVMLVLAVVFGTVRVMTDPEIACRLAGGTPFGTRYESSCWKDGKVIVP